VKKQKCVEYLLCKVVLRLYRVEKQLRKALLFHHKAIQSHPKGIQRHHKAIQSHHKAVMRLFTGVIPRFRGDKRGGRG
jgi:hypothetical protein